MLPKKKYIEEIQEIVTDNKTILYCQSKHLYFQWNSWLLCEVANNKSNPIHHAIFTHCHLRKDGEVIATRWQPTYEEPHAESLYLAQLYYWKPILVIPSKNFDFTTL